MDTLDLVGADDGVLEGGSVLEDKDGVGVATLSLASAVNATAVGLHSTIERAGDFLRGIVGNRALGGRDGEVGALADGVAVGGRGRGGESQDGGSDGSLHFDGFGWLGSWKSKKRKFKEVGERAECVKQKAVK